MNTDLLTPVLAALRRREQPLRAVSMGSGVPYDTLKKIASGSTPNPGVLHVQRLASYFGNQINLDPNALEETSHAQRDQQNSSN
jgi:hypothetical protein